MNISLKKKIYQNITFQNGLAFIITTIQHKKMNVNNKPLNVIPITTLKYRKKNKLKGIDINVSKFSGIASILKAAVFFF